MARPDLGQLPGLKDTNINMIMGVFNYDKANIIAS